jgi:hypothetical protein
MNVKNVGQSMSMTEKEMAIAQNRVQRELNIYQCISSNGNVMSAENYISQAEKTLGSVNTNVSEVSIISKRSLGKKNVYNFEAVNTHNYILSNGVVAHNCDLISQLLMMEVIQPPISFDSEDEEENKPLKKRSGMWKHSDMHYEGDDEDNGAYSSYVD